MTGTNRELTISHGAQFQAQVCLATTTRNGGFRREMQPRRQHWFLNKKSGFPLRTPAFCSVSKGQRRLGEKEYRAPSVTPGVALRVGIQGIPRRSIGRGRRPAGARRHARPGSGRSRVSRRARRGARPRDRRQDLRLVKSILDNNLDRRPAAARSTDTTPIQHPNIRGPLLQLGKTPCSNHLLQLERARLR